MPGDVERVHGVEPQPVDVVVGEPSATESRIAAHLVRAVLVEVDQVAPGGVARDQVGTEERQVVARRPEVVVDDVLDHAEARAWQASTKRW